MALSQTNIKRLLGYSSISHLGYLLVALIAHGARCRWKRLAFTAGYLFSSLGAFGVVSLMSTRSAAGCRFLYSYRGLFWHRPVLAAVMTVMMLSLAGIPMTLGFIGKFYVLAVGVRAQLVVAGRRRGQWVPRWFVLLPARCGESLPARAAATGTRRRQTGSTAQAVSWC